MFWSGVFIITGIIIIIIMILADNDISRQCFRKLRSNVTATQPVIALIQPAGDIIILVIPLQTPLKKQSHMDPGFSY